MRGEAMIRYDWTLAEIEAIYTLPLPKLVFRAQQVHRAFHPPDEVQGCALLSIKTGGCPEDCAYCPQSAHYRTGVQRTELMSVEEGRGGGRSDAGPGSDALLHGGGLARSSFGARFRTPAGDGAARASPGPGSVRLPGDAHPGAGVRLGGRWTDGLQPQSRYVPPSIMGGSSRRAHTRTG
jgi:hypothetical protein